VIIAISPLGSAILDRVGKAVKPGPAGTANLSAAATNTIADAAKPAQRQDDRK